MLYILIENRLKRFKYLKKKEEFCKCKKPDIHPQFKNICCNCNNYIKNYPVGKNPPKRGQTPKKPKINMDAAHKRYEKRQERLKRGKELRTVMIEEGLIEVLNSVFFLKLLEEFRAFNTIEDQARPVEHLSHA